MRRLLILSNSVLFLTIGFLHFLYINDFKRLDNLHLKAKLEDVVQIPYSLAEVYEAEIRQRGESLRETVKEEFISLSEQMSYGKNNFFFIMDGSGRMVAHPLRPGLSWWNMLYETDSEDNYIFRDLIALAKRDGQVILETEWQSKYYEDIYEKQVILGKYYWPWDWIICTVAYESEITPVRAEHTWNILIVAAIVFIINNLLILVIFRFGKKSVIKRRSS